MKLSWVVDKVLGLLDQIYPDPSYEIPNVTPDPPRVLVYCKECTFFEPGVHVDYASRSKLPGKCGHPDNVGFISSAFERVLKTRLHSCEYLNHWNNCAWYKAKGITNDA